MRWLVVGAGFRGIVAAYLLASSGHRVTLRDAAKVLGGVLNSSEWKGFYLDKGCHLFRESGDRVNAVLQDLLAGDIAPVEVHYASVTNGKKVEGLAIPDLAAYGAETAEAIRRELPAALTAPPAKHGTIEQALRSRFGATAARLLADIAQKMYRSPPGSLDAAGFPLTPFRRIKFLPDDEAEAWKADPLLDDRVASSARASANRNFYPGRHGLLGFCERAEERLKRLGVSLELGSPLANADDARADRILWTSGLAALEKLATGRDAISRHMQHVPMVLHYFVIPKSAEGPYAYVQNFDGGDSVFRASVPGRYAPQACPDGLSYACCEVPTDIGSPEWNDPDAHAGHAWKEIVRQGIVRCAEPMDSRSVKISTSYWLPRVGYSRAVAALELPSPLRDRIQCTDDLVFSKNEIVSSLVGELNA